jgi:hypothetical protein
MQTDDLACAVEAGGLGGPEKTKEDWLPFSFGDRVTKCARRAV